MEGLNENGYYVLTGENNSGKTEVLFDAYLNSETEGAEKIYIPLQRFKAMRSIEYKGWQPDKVFDFFKNFGKSREELEQVIDFIARQIVQGLYTYGYPQDIFAKVDDMTTRMGFGTISRKQEIGMGNGRPHVMGLDGKQAFPLVQSGSGINFVLPILFAIANPVLKEIYIDEPELGLESGLQKILLSFFHEESRNKRIVVTTHSHLMLNRNTDSINNNFEIKGKTAEPFRTHNDLSQMTLKKLGGQLSDLFLPENYLVVEGSSDQILIEKIINILGKDSNKVVCLSATGITNVQNRIQAVKEQILPLVINKNPYSEIVVSLVDKPVNKTEEVTCAELKENRESRYFELPYTSLEEYIHEDLYKKVGLDKTTCLKDIDENKGNYKKLKEIKEKISKSIVQDLTLDESRKYLGIMVDAVEEAFSPLD